MGNVLSKEATAHLEKQNESKSDVDTNNADNVDKQVYSQLRSHFVYYSDQI